MVTGKPVIRGCLSRATWDPSIGKDSSVGCVI